MTDEIRDQINDIIEGEIQNRINDYIENQGKGFKGQELKVNVSQDEVDKLIKEYRNDALVSILIWNFDDTVVSLIPEGDVPFTPNDSPLGTDHTSLRREAKNLYHFVKGGNDCLNGIRRETMFIQMLEGLHPDEANIIILAKDKRLSETYSVTYEQVKEAFPDITWGGRS